MSSDNGNMPMPMPMPPDSMSNNSMSPTDMMMHMSFYWGKDAIIFFSGWPAKSLGMYILALFFVFFLAVAIEVLSMSPIVKSATNPMVGAFTHTSVYAVRMGFAYMVMLSVMSYNLGIFIVAVAGHAVGFFILKSRALAMANRAETETTPKV